MATSISRSRSVASELSPGWIVYPKTTVSRTDVLIALTRWPCPRLEAEPAGIVRRQADLNVQLRQGAADGRRIVKNHVVVVDDDAGDDLFLGESKHRRRADRIIWYRYGRRGAPHRICNPQPGTTTTTLPRHNDNDKPHIHHTTLRVFLTLILHTNMVDM
jgi:hypothetical protein